MLFHVSEQVAKPVKLFLAGWAGVFHSFPLFFGLEYPSDALGGLWRTAGGPEGLLWCVVANSAPAQPVDGGENDVDRTKRQCERA